jgi:flagellar protein FliO/FliZ
MDMFEQILALTEDRTVRMALALAAVLLLILVIAAIYRRIARRGPSTKRGRVARLAILEAIPVDQRRRLILLRRDNTEHLVMIGGPTDLVVEEGIHRQARQPANKRPAPERQVQERTAPERAAPESSAPDRAPPERATPEPADVPRVPIGAKLSQSVETPKPIAPVPEVSHTPAPTPAPAAKPISPAAPIAPITPVIPAAIAATTLLPDADKNPVTEATATLEPVADPVEETPEEEDPQIAEMERKLQDALKAPGSEVSAAPADDNAPDDLELELPDLETSLEAAIADAVASDSADIAPEQAGENETGSLSERLENISPGKSPSG